MSYEGRNQFLCTNGHQFDRPESYGNSDERCSICNEEPAWCNSVDDTNCESDGIILDFSSLVIEVEVTETCNLGHEHIIKPARYRPPTKEEEQALRHYRDGERYHRYGSGPRAEAVAVDDGA